MSQEFSSVADLAVNGPSHDISKPIDTSGWKLETPQALVNPSTPIDTSRWKLESPAPVLQATKSAPPTSSSPWAEQPIGGPSTLENVIRQITEGAQNIKGAVTQPHSSLMGRVDQGIAGIGNFANIVPELLGGPRAALKGALLGPTQYKTFTEAIEGNFGLKPDTFASAALSTGAEMLADPLNVLLPGTTGMRWLSQAAGAVKVARTAEELRAAAEATARIPSVEQRAATVSHLTPSKDPAVRTAQDISNAILDAAGHPAGAVKTNAPVTLAHANPISIPPGPLTAKIQVEPFKTIHELIPDPLARVELANSHPGDVLGAALGIEPGVGYKGFDLEQRLQRGVGLKGEGLRTEMPTSLATKPTGPAETALSEALLPGKRVGQRAGDIPPAAEAAPARTGASHADLADDAAVRQSLTGLLLRDEHIQEWGTMGREYGQAAREVGEEGLPPIAGGSVNYVKAGTAHALAQGLWEMGPGKIMQGGRVAGKILSDVTRGLLMQTGRVVRAMGPEGAQLGQMLDKAHMQMKDAFGFAANAFNKISKNLTDKDWAAVQPYHDLELTGERDALKLGHPDVANLAPLTPEQEKLRGAMSAYTQQAIDKLMNVTGWDYTKARDTWKNFMTEGAPKGARYTPKVEFFNAVERAERHLAFAENFGAKSEKANALIEAIKNRELGVGTVPLAKPFGAYDSQHAQGWYHLVTGTGPQTAEKIGAEIAGKVTSLLVAAKLPLAVLRHAGQVIYAAHVADIHSLGKGFMDLVRKADPEFIDKVGMVNSETFRHMQKLEAGGDVELWGGDVLRKTGLYWMRDKNLKWSAYAGREMFLNTAGKMDQPQSATLLAHMGFSPEDIARIKAGGANELDQIHAGRWMAETSQFGGKVDDLPLFVQQSPWVRLAFLLKAFHFRASSLMRDALWTRGLQDMIKHGPNANNIRPFLAFGVYAYPVGEFFRSAQIAATYLGGGFLNGKGFLDYYNKRTPPDALHRYIDRMSFMGTIGAIEFARQAYKATRGGVEGMAGFLGGPATSMAAAGARAAGETYESVVEKGEFPGKGILSGLEAASGGVPGMGLELPNIIRDLSKMLSGQ